MKYTDSQRIEKILNYAEKLHKYVIDNNIQKSDLLNDYSLQWLVTTPLYNIGENVYCLSDEFKNKYSDIKWNMIAGLRHRLVHDYDGTNWNIIAEVVLNELPLFIKQVKELL